MKGNYKLAIIGNKETILGFKALGLDTYDANSHEEALKILFDLKGATSKIKEAVNEKQAKYAIIFVTEDLIKDISKDDYKKLSKTAMPAIIPVPSSKGSSGYGLKRIGKIVEQAVGSDIFS